jgi:hypothetical protein
MKGKVHMKEQVPWKSSETKKKNMLVSGGYRAMSARKL